MIGDDGDWMGGPLEVVLPFREGKNDCKKFSIIDVIVPFCHREGF